MIDAKLVERWAKESGAERNTDFYDWSFEPSAIKDFAELAAAYGAEKERAEWEGLSEDHQANLRQVIELRAALDFKGTV